MEYKLNGTLYTTDETLEVKDDDWCICSYQNRKIITRKNNDPKDVGKSDFEKVITTDNNSLNKFYNFPNGKTKTLKEKFKETIKIFPDYPKPGIMFEDINPIFLNSNLCKEITEELCFLTLSNGNIDAICAIESRGFFFGILMSQKLRIPLFMARKAGKLPGEIVSYKYNLEYGTATIEIQKGIIKPNWNVMIHDDILATGGTAAAAAELVQMEGGKVSGFSFLNSLNLGGEEKLGKYSENIIFAVK